MAASSSPYGLRPVKRLDGMPWAGSFRMYPIKSGYTTAIAYGDPVVLTASGADRGLIDRMNTTTTATTQTNSGTFLGVLVGVQYTDPVLGPTFRQHYPGSISASDIMGHVVDDPDVLFECQADGAITAAAIGNNAGLIQTVVTNASTGRSGLSVRAASIASTNTLPIRIVDFVERPGFSTAGDARTDLLVRINTHFHRTATGTASS